MAQEVERVARGQQVNADILTWASSQATGSLARVLYEAYMSGALKVVIEGRTVEYRSLSDLERVMSSSYNSSLSASQRRPSVTYAQFSRG